MVQGFGLRVLLRGLGFRVLIRFPGPLGKYIVHTRNCAMMLIE